jgi:hypothetical protein
MRYLLKFAEVVMRGHFKKPMQEGGGSACATHEAGGEGRDLLQWSNCLHTSKKNQPGADQRFTQDLEMSRLKDVF